MKKIKLLIELIKTSTKAKIITGVVTVSILGGGTAAGIIAYNNSQATLSNSDKSVVKEYQKEESTKVSDKDDKEKDKATEEAIDKLKEEILKLDPKADVTVIKDDLEENKKYYEDLKNKLNEEKKNSVSSEDKEIVSKPVESKPVESKPVENKPVESKPVESKPVESKPVESKPVESKPVESKPVQPSGAIAPSGYNGGLMINWDLTGSVNSGNSNGYRQAINREYFNRYLNGESRDSLFANVKGITFEETIGGVKKEGRIIDLQIINTTINSNDINAVAQAESGLYVNLKTHGLQNADYDYVESFVVYDGTTNIVYKMGVRYGFADVVDNGL